MGGREKEITYIIPQGGEKSMLNYHPYHDAQQEPAAAYCDKCRQEVYQGEARFQWEGRLICKECFTAVVERALREYPEQVALEMGLEVERYL